MAKPCNSSARNRFRQRVQMVFQDPYGSLHPRHTVDTILSEPARVHRLDRIEQRVVAALEEVGLDASFRFRYPHQISGGQRQRVSVARALITDPRIVLLDEPTSALDVSVQAEVLNLLMRLKREHGLTYVLVSHNLAVVAHVCETLSVMQNGAIVETMSVQQLREHNSTMPYTRQLLTASLGYDRGAIDAFEEFGLNGIAVMMFSAGVNVMAVIAVGGIQHETNVFGPYPASFRGVCRA